MEETKTTDSSTNLKTEVSVTDKNQNNSSANCISNDNGGDTKVPGGDSRCSSSSVDTAIEKSSGCDKRGEGVTANCASAANSEKDSSSAIDPAGEKSDDVTGPPRNQSNGEPASINTVNSSSQSSNSAPIESVVNPTVPDVSEGSSVDGTTPQQGGNVPDSKGDNQTVLWENGTDHIPDEKGDFKQNLPKDSATCASGMKTGSDVNPSFTLSLSKLSQLSRGLLWDIQGKRYALIETLGYIHKAISQLLLAQKPNSLSATQTETVQSHSEQHEFTSQVSRDISSFTELDSNEVLREHVHNHEQLEHIMSHIGHHDCKKRHNSDPAPPLLHGLEGLGSHDHHHSNHAHRFARSVSSDTHTLDFHIHHHEHTCVAHSNHDPTNDSPLDLCTSCDWLNKSRKVLWEDEPVNPLGAEHPGKGKLMSIVNPAKYINTPDEWYNMTADQKYSKPYVTMAILKEEQEYMMNELKRGPDAIQVLLCVFRGISIDHFQVIPMDSQTMDITHLTVVFMPPL